MASSLGRQAARLCVVDMGAKRPTARTGGGGESVARPRAERSSDKTKRNDDGEGDENATASRGVEANGNVEFGFERVEALTGRRRMAESKKKKNSGGFESMEMLPEVFRAVKRKGYRVPTPIQRKSIPPALEGRDVVAMARTGTART